MLGNLKNFYAEQPRQEKNLYARFKVQAQFKSTASKIHPGKSGVASIPKEPKARP
jgi:hypothetical protein